MIQHAIAIEIDQMKSIIQYEDTTMKNNVIHLKCPNCDETEKFVFIGIGKINQVQIFLEKWLLN